MWVLLTVKTPPCWFSGAVVVKRCFIFHRILTHCASSSITEEPWRSWSTLSRHVELCHDPLGASYKRSAFWSFVTHGSWHEGDQCSITFLDCTFSNSDQNVLWLLHSNLWLNFFGLSKFLCWCGDESLDT